jgi:hypothetical protein
MDLIDFLLCLAVGGVVAGLGLFIWSGRKYGLDIHPPREQDKDE